MLTKAQKFLSAIRNPEVISDVKIAAANTAGGSVIAGITWNELVAMATFVYFVAQTVYILIKCHKAVKGKDDEE